MAAKLLKVCCVYYGMVLMSSVQSLWGSVAELERKQLRYNWYLLPSEIRVEKARALLRAYPRENNLELCARFVELDGALYSRAHAKEFVCCVLHKLLGDPIDNSDEQFRRYDAVTKKVAKLFYTNLRCNRYSLIPWGVSLEVFVPQFVQKYAPVLLKDLDTKCTVQSRCLAPSVALFQGEEYVRKTYIPEDWNILKYKVLAAFAVQLKNNHGGRSLALLQLASGVNEIEAMVCLRRIMGAVYKAHKIDPATVSETQRPALVLFDEYSYQGIAESLQDCLLMSPQVPLWMAAKALEAVLCKGASARQRLGFRPTRRKKQLTKSILHPRLATIREEGE